MGGLLPLNNEQPAFAELYILDPLEANICRGAYLNRLLPGVLGKIQNILEANNPYVQLYKQEHKILASRPPEEQDSCANKLLLLPTPIYGTTTFPLL